MRKALPEQYPFLQVIQDVKEPKPQHVYVRGAIRTTSGEDAPPRFLGDPVARRTARRSRTAAAGWSWRKPSPIPDNPLTARVMVNRIWQHHFGQGIVRTPSNFGNAGRPAQPSRAAGLPGAPASWKTSWSVKAMHREIMLSAAYQMGADYSATNYAVDPENRLLWRANRRRLDVEALRDSLLFVSGNLDLMPGGRRTARPTENHRRTVYGFVSRRKLGRDAVAVRFSQPNSYQRAARSTTNVPLQRLFFMNSGLVAQRIRRHWPPAWEEAGDQRTDPQSLPAAVRPRATTARTEARAGVPAASRMQHGRSMRRCC